jgi:2-polyprenyl-3-methyl-5-hydroxy-6-metoxy-1,4-benzoquinol methylase
VNRRLRARGLIIGRPASRELDKAMVSRQEVVYAYRLLLGREPESEAAIEGHLRAESWLDLRQRFVRSSEFQAIVGREVVRREQYENIFAGPASVDVEISAEHFKTLLRHIKQAWQDMGEKRPHWSVLTAPEFQPDRIQENLSAFYESGMQSWLALERAASRSGRELRSDWTAFELGCGVGRVTAQLAKHFHLVVAYDISLPHINIAKEYLNKRLFNNIEFCVLSELDQLQNLKPFDLFYSIIVLQHNPPPLIYQILKIVFSKLKPGGCVYFQVPVSKIGYQFVIEDYLRGLAPHNKAMETHILPQRFLFELMYNSGVRVLDIQRDFWQSSPYVSLSLFGEKSELG